MISRVLIYDTGRNSLIVEDIEKNAGRFKTILVLTDRKAHPVIRSHTTFRQTAGYF